MKLQPPNRSRRSTDFPEGQVGSRELVRLAGLTYRQLDYAVRRGYLSPVQPAQGSGSARAFDSEGVIKAVIYARLIQAGIVPEQSAKIMNSADGEKGIITVELAEGISIRVDCRLIRQSLQRQ